MICITVFLCDRIEVYIPDPIIVVITVIMVDARIGCYTTI